MSVPIVRSMTVEGVYMTTEEIVTQEKKEQEEKKRKFH